MVAEYNPIFERILARDEGEALAGALKGNFWRQVAVTTAAGLISVAVITGLYFLLRIVGVDLLERLRQLEQLFPGG